MLSRKLPYAYCYRIASIAERWHNVERLEARPRPAPFKTMHRLIAKLMVLVFVAGTFAPLAGAVSTPAMHEHCMRQPLGARTEAVPSCHHHANAAASEQPASVTAPTSSVRATPCCSGHACCRSMVRSQWAQVGLRPLFQQTDRTGGRIASLPTRVRTLDPVAYHAVRGPPVL